jgi:hypothetical protein
MVTADPGNYLFFVWGSIGVWTQCFTLLKKALLLLEPCLFALLILEIVSQFLHRMAWLTILLFKLPTVPEMTSVATMSSFFKWRWGSPKFFFFFASGWPRTVILWISAYQTAWDDRHMPPMPSYWLRWDLANSLLGLTLNHDPPYVSLPSS